MKQVFLLVFIFFLVSCNNRSQSDFINGSEITDSPKKLEKIFKTEVASSKKVSETKSAIPCVVPVSREDLDSYKMVIKMYNGKTDAGITVPGFGGMKLGKEEISYSLYYVEPKIVKCDTTEKVYGVGYSMHILIKKLKRGLSLDKLPAVAASVQIENGKTEVFYSLQSYGISGIPIVKFFKPVFNKPFDVEGFNNMQSSIDGIHEFLSDSTLSAHLRFNPKELSFINPSDLK